MTIFNLFLILIMVVALLLILIVLVQNPKGGGLSSSIAGGAGSTIGGVQSTNKFLDKGTWTLAIALLALILLSNFAIPRENNSDSLLKNTVESVETTTADEDVVEDLIEDTTEESTQE